MNFNNNKAVCLVLDIRYDSAIQIQKETTSRGINTDLFIAGDGTKNLKYNHIDVLDLPPRFSNSINYSTWYKRPNAYNAWLCHKKIMELAIESSLDFLLMLEDDVVFEKDFLETLEKTASFFNSNEWDMIYFGWYSNGHLTPTKNQNVFRMNGGAGFHGVLLSRKIMELLIKFDPIGPFDWIVGTYINPRFNCYAIYPSIITQQSGYSYVEGGVLEKPDRKHK